jgi:hypothetical protein
MTLLQEIEAACTPELIASGEHGEIAALVSVGRTRPSSTEIGNGTILEVLGLTLGTQVLDVINSTPAYKYVVPLLEQGRLLIGSVVAQAAVQAFVPALLTQAQADSLKSLGIAPAPVSVGEVIEALKG